MQFSEITGLEDVKEKLVRSVRKDQLAHALLLSGEKGCPNLPLALAFATFLNCENRSEHDSCGVCPSCAKNRKFIHPDLNFVFPVTTRPDLKDKKIKIISQTFLTEWREFLSERNWADEETWANYLGSENRQFNISREESRQIISNLSLTAFEGNYKIMLIWLPEYMHPAAANGILKILEEPSAKTVFLLVTNDREKLLQTILSRAITVSVRKYHQEELVSILVERHGIDPGEAEKLARTEGDLEAALKSDDSQGELMSEFRNWLLMCYSFKREDTVNYTEVFTKRSKVWQRSFFRYGNSVLREVLVSRNGVGSISRAAPTEEDFIKRLSGKLNESRIEKFSRLFDGFLYDMERNVNPKIAFLDVSVKIATIFREK